jgi:uncharacterized MAPEG superfamily protein
MTMRYVSGLGVEADLHENPKGILSNVKNRGLPPDLEGRYLRAEAAQDNGCVALPFFASAVVDTWFCRGLWQ